MVTQEHLGEYQNIINEIFVTAPRAVMEENMLKIGEFSKLSRISIRMLRYYDDIGLIKPYFIDPVNGYRYYHEEQLFIIGRITSLKDMGFSLSDIIKIMDCYNNKEKIDTFLKNRIDTMNKLKSNEIQYHTDYFVLKKVL